MDSLSKKNNMMPNSSDSIAKKSKKAEIPSLAGSAQSILSSEHIAQLLNSPGSEEDETIFSSSNDLQSLKFKKNEPIDLSKVLTQFIPGATEVEGCGVDEEVKKCELRDVEKIDNQVQHTVHVIMQCKNDKFKNILVDLLFELACCLSFVDNTHEGTQNLSDQYMMAASGFEKVIANLPNKNYWQLNLFNYLPQLKDDAANEGIVWFKGLEKKIESIKEKPLTEKFISSLPSDFRKLPVEKQKQANFGCEVIKKAKEVFGSVNNQLSPCFQCENELKSGESMSAMYFSMRESCFKILNRKRGIENVKR